MTVILGVDPGLANLGWCLLDSRDARVRRSGYVPTSKGDETGDMQRRVSEVLSAMRTVVDSLPVALAVVEWPSAGGSGLAGKMNAKAASQTIAVAGAVLGLLTALRIPTLTPAPVTWRTALGCERGKDDALHARLARIYAGTAAAYRKGALPHVLDGLGLALYGRLIASNLISTRIAP